MNPEQICNQVREVARETGEYIRKEQRSFSADNIEAKGVHNYVTHVDIRAEEQIIAALKKILPGAGIIAEEGTANEKGKNLNWIIDPLDGTTNFIHGLPPYAISIALADRHEVLAGVIYEMILDECFYAWKGGSAFLNDEPIRVSSKEKVSDALIATGFPYTDFERLEPFMHSMRYFMKNSHGLRRLGSAATDLAYVACGRFEAFYEYGLNAWDVAAGELIIREAGGKVCDFYKKQDYLYGRTIVASNSRIFEEFSGIIHRIMIQGDP